MIWSPIQRPNRPGASWWSTDTKGAGSIYLLISIDSVLNKCFLPISCFHISASFSLLVCRNIPIGHIRLFEEISETSNKEFFLRISFDLIVRFAAIGRDIKCVAKLRRHRWECGRFHVNSVRNYNSVVHKGDSFLPNNSLRKPIAKWYRLWRSTGSVPKCG